MLFRTELCSIQLQRHESNVASYFRKLFHRFYILLFSQIFVSETFQNHFGARLITL